LIYLNDGFEKLTGYTKQEVLGRNCRFLQGDQTNQESVNIIRNAIKEGKECTVELLNFKKNGGPFWNRLSLTPLKDDSDNVTHYVGIQSDITELKETKEFLEEANQNLEIFRQRITKELERAKVAQEFILPAQMPHGNGIIFASKFVPMVEIGGDFYDVIELDPGIYGILIADVTGHGIPAALLTFMSAITFKNTATKYKSPQKVIKDINAKLYGEMPDGSFASMFYAIYDSNTKKLTFTQAGHPDGIVIRSNTKEILPLSSDGTLVGAFSSTEISYGEEEIELVAGDKLLLYTDAIIESMNPDGDMLGVDQFYEFLLDNSSMPIDTLFENIYSFGLNYSNRTAYDDDFTIVGFEVL